MKTFLLLSLSFSYLSSYRTLCCFLHMQKNVMSALSDKFTIVDDHSFSRTKGFVVGGAYLLDAVT